MASGWVASAALIRLSAATGEIVGALGGASSAVRLKAGSVAVVAPAVSVRVRLVLLLSPPAGRVPVVGFSVARSAFHAPAASTVVV